MEWIKCSDRLPDEGQDMLYFGEDVYQKGKYKNGNFKYWGIDLFDNMGWRTEEYTVTHWMPLPEKPDSDGE